MKRAIFAVAVLALLPATSLMAGEKEQDRLKHSGEVLIEIMNIPDSIPRGILDRAECVLIFPSVKKLAIGVGGSYGRGAMSCRSGPEYTGPCGPPPIYALERGNSGIQLRRPTTELVPLSASPTR